MVLSLQDESFSGAALSLMTDNYFPQIKKPGSAEFLFQEMK
jgi:hypothetical protein